MDDLTAPLGVDSRGSRQRTLPLGRIAAALVAILVAVAALWVILVDDPTGGEPSLVVAIDQTTTAIGPAAIGMAALPPTRSMLPIDPDAPALAELAPGRPPAPLAGGADGVVIRSPGDATPVEIALVPEAALLEDGPDGRLPRVGSDGRRPFDAYARPAPAGIGTASRIAIVIGALGISQSGTAAALDRLPPTVTLAFAPYGNDLPRWVDLARTAGHELLLQLPMEPFDYPNNDPGPHTLLADASSEENLGKLEWLLARITMYAGTVNYMGARFTGEGTAMTPVLEELGRRGLMYLDDRSSSRSRAAEIAPGKLPFAAADLVLDAEATPAAIDARLEQLEQIARDRGSAVGVASAFPASIDRIAVWAERAAARGFVLVPVTALARDPITTGAAGNPN